MSHQLLELQKLVNQYTLVNRRHYIPGTDRHEDDSSHSISVAVICWHYMEKLQLKSLRPEKVFKYALIHDLVEIYAGDVITYASKEARKQKIADEDRALETLKVDLNFEPDMVKVLSDYQSSADEESMFVWTCDKMQAYIQGEVDNWRPYIEVGVTNDVFVKKLDEQLAKAPACIRPEFKRLAQGWIKSYANRLASV